MAMASTNQVTGVAVSVFLTGATPMVDVLKA